MKKGTFLFFGIFLIHFAHAQLITQKPYFTISSFNDSWGGGFTEIHDDMRSFGFELDYQTNLFTNHPQVRLRYSSFTNRFPADSSRLDELELYVRIPVYSLHDNWYFSAITGGYIIGDLGGESFQNEVHSNVGVTTLALPYSSKNEINGLLGGEIRGDINIWTIGDQTEVHIQPRTEYFVAPSYLQSFNINTSFAAVNAYTDKIELGIGYNHQDVFSEKTRAVAALSENGLYFNYGLRLGAATYSIYVFPNGNFSLGMIGLTLFTGKGRKMLKQVDLTAEFGSLMDENGFYHRYLLNKLTEDHPKFQWDLHYQFWTLSQSKNSQYPDIQGHFHQFSFGGNFNFIEPTDKFQVLPYVSLRAGYKTESFYGGDQPAPYTSVWSFSGIGEGGLRLKFPAKILHNNCYYGLTGNYQYVLTWYKSSDVQLNNGHEFAKSFGYFGLGGFVMIDL